MARSGLGVAEIFRDYGPAWREANRGHISLEQMKVMSAIERCRTAALGGHVARCENDGCAYTVIGAGLDAGDVPDLLVLLQNVVSSLATDLASALVTSVPRAER